MHHAAQGMGSLLKNMESVSNVPMAKLMQPSWQVHAGYKLALIFQIEEGFIMIGNDAKWSFRAQACIALTLNVTASCKVIKLVKLPSK